MVTALHRTLSLRLYARRNWLITRLSSSSPTSGILVFTTATSAAYTCVKPGDAICAFIRERMSSARPRMMFSRSSSSTICFMLGAFTLFTSPLIDFFSASHVIRWYSSDALSFTPFIICASLYGGM